MTSELVGLLQLLRESSVYQEWLSALAARQPASGRSILRAARPYLLAALAQDWGGPLLVLTADSRRAYNLSEQMPLWLPQAERLHRFPENAALFYDRAPWEPGVIRGRIATLAALRSAQAPPIIVASARALMMKTMPCAVFDSATLQLALGQRQPMDKLILQWVGMGYKPGPLVTEPGQFSRRGGILDIYPMASRYPLRIEYFDDEIDSLRHFDPSSQRSVGRVEAAGIVPAREALPQLTGGLGQSLGGWAESLQRAPEDISAVQGDIEALAQGSAFPTLEHYLPYLYEPPGDLLQYLPENALILIEDPDYLRESVRDIAEQAEGNRAEALATGQIAADHPQPYHRWERLEALLASRQCIALSKQPGQAALFVPGARYGGQLRSLLTQLRRQLQTGHRAVIITEQVERLASLWNEQDAKAFIPTVDAVSSAPAAGSIQLLRGAAAEGWTLSSAGQPFHFITDAEIFGWARPEPRRRFEAHQRATAQPVDSSYSDWQEGAYVVHVDYGIGRFMGLCRRVVKQTQREYLLVEYADGDSLYVPVHQSDRLARYVGAQDKMPKLNKIGRAEQWLRARKRAQRNAEQEAKELLAIYSRRAQSQGHAFSADSAWQHEMEASFPFVETQDQLRVIREVKADMESRKPMDRLICGDVGFGKTEIALRAAFKAVQDGYQVALLVPTTVLAQQHYEHFRQRLQAFPVEIALMSRFRTKAQQQGSLERISSGEVDIVIGTHRLLSADVRFKRLGLMIVDEEQRFGVKQKEHFKKLRARIDILTLTATPIPRTLYLSLGGVRDISMIQSAPEERLPVLTQVGAWDDKLARRAILREMERGGQAFVVHNRVQSIHALRERLERIVPEAGMAVAHGQLSPRALEAVMAEFTRGQHDILLATSIIENGIDMPRVNTLIVDRADMFGLSQLYQLRGRVGRSAQQAYAYFFHSAGRLKEEARTRLETLAENTQLGAGFQVAIRDLEMRGGGDILSMRQSGHIASVGLHLYSEMMRQAVKQGRQAAGSAEPEPASAREGILIDLPLPAYLPQDWIPEMALRLQLYRRLGNIQKVEDIEAMQQELLDRFGQLPAAVEGLLYQIRVKVMAQAIRATSIRLPRQHVLIKLPYLATVRRELLALALGGGVDVTRTEVQLPVNEEDWTERLLDLLERLRQRLPAMGVVDAAS